MQQKFLCKSKAGCLHFNPFFTGIFCNKIKHEINEYEKQNFNPFFTGIFCNKVDEGIRAMWWHYFNPFFTGIFCNTNLARYIEELRKKISIPSLLEFFATMNCPLSMILKNKFQSLLYWNFLQRRICKGKSV